MDEIKLKQTGKDRLKIKLQFTKEEEKKSVVIHSEEIQKNQKTFEERYTLGDVVGEGTHAVVKKCWKKVSKIDNTKKLYAVKIFRSGDPEIISMIKKTYINTRFLTHPTVGAAIELFINEKTEISYLVMEYCSFPSLQSLLERQNNLNESTIKIIAKNLLEAVSYIQMKGICHRDIKPDNILFDSTLKSQTPLKLVDFGVSKRFIQNEPGKIGAQNVDMWTQTGNIHYCAPEIFKGGRYNSSIDLWSVGIVLYQCLTGRLPFNEISIMDTIAIMSNENEKKHLQNEKFKHASKNIQDLIQRLLEIDSLKRINATDALEHPFISQTNIHQLMQTKDDQHIIKNNTYVKTVESLTQSIDRRQIIQKATNVQFSVAINKNDVILEEDEVAQSQKNIDILCRTRKFDQNLQARIDAFKEQNQLTEIHVLKKPKLEDQFDIALISSYNTYQINGIKKAGLLKSLNESNKVSSLECLDNKVKDLSKFLQWPINLVDSQDVQYKKNTDSSIKEKESQFDSIKIPGILVDSSIIEKDLYINLQKKKENQLDNTLLQNHQSDCNKKKSQIFENNQMEFISNVVESCEIDQNNQNDQAKVQNNQNISSSYFNDRAYFFENVQVDQNISPCIQQESFRIPGHLESSQINNSQSSSIEKLNQDQLYTMMCQILKNKNLDAININVNTSDNINGVQDNTIQNTQNESNQRNNLNFVNNMIVPQEMLDNYLMDKNDQGDLQNIDQINEQFLDRGLNLVKMVESVYNFENDKNFKQNNPNQDRKQVINLSKIKPEDQNITQFVQNQGNYHLSINYNENQDEMIKGLVNKLGNQKEYEKQEIEDLMIISEHSIDQELDETQLNCNFDENFQNIIISNSYLNIDIIPEKSMKESNNLQSETNNFHYQQFINDGSKFKGSQSNDYGEKQILAGKLQNIMKILRKHKTQAQQLSNYDSYREQNTKISNEQLLEILKRQNGKNKQRYNGKKQNKLRCKTEVSSRIDQISDCFQEDLARIDKACMIRKLLSQKNSLQQSVQKPVNIISNNQFQSIDSIIIQSKYYVQTFIKSRTHTPKNLDVNVQLDDSIQTQNLIDCSIITLIKKDLNKCKQKQLNFKKFFQTIFDNTKINDKFSDIISDDSNNIIHSLQLQPIQLSYDMKNCTNTGNNIDIIENSQNSKDQYQIIENNQVDNGYFIQQQKESYKSHLQFQIEKERILN